MTKIVATIGPASESPEVMRQMIEAGMDVARINFSHGDIGSHQPVMDNLRQAAPAVGRRLTILADLPGPKMRLGQIAPDPVELTGIGLYSDHRRHRRRCRPRLGDFRPSAPGRETGRHPTVSDGLLQLEVVHIDGPEVHCRVEVGESCAPARG